MSDLAAVLKRLEAATIRLEGLVSTGNNAAPAPAATASAPAPSTQQASVSASVAAFDSLIANELQATLSKANAIGGMLKDQASALAAAFSAQRAFLVVASQSKKPAAADFAPLLKDTQTALQSVIAVREDKAARASPFFNHLSMVSEGIPALGWVAVEPTPVPYIGEMKDAAQFYSNRIIKEFKDKLSIHELSNLEKKDKTHVEFAQAFGSLLTELQAYVKKWHTTGVAWNPKGGDAKAVAASAPAVSAAGPPPPPPAPTAAQLDSGKSAPAVAPSAGLFAALNSQNLTSGLRKVDKSEMTHKNPELRSGGVVAASDKPASAVATPKASVVAQKPPKLALEGNKWIVENQVNATNLVIETAELRHTVYIYNCQNSTIQVKGKVNAVVIDNCKKSGLVVDSIVSTLDVVNCKSIQLQILGRAPTVAIDKTDGCQVYVSKLCVEGDSVVEVLTAMSSECNVLVEGEGEDGGFKERAVPEQLRSVVKRGEMKVEVVEHKG
ncbi:F-actin-capping protein subunit alpha [Podochytrium sp. JEL0797]|nr:F-actin-capping protein subunit alpha [Podochytrium sp. JEL0797]